VAAAGAALSGTLKDQPKVVMLAGLCAQTSTVGGDHRAEIQLNLERMAAVGAERARRASSCHMFGGERM